MNDLKKETRRIQTNKIFEGYDQNFGEPLYLYPKVNNHLEPELIKNFEQNLLLTFTKEKELSLQGEVCFMNSPEVRPEFKLSFTQTDILDYVYAILYSSSIREKSKTKIFPEVPYPTEASAFWRFTALGSELREIHLLECPRVEKITTPYPISGNNIIDEIKYRHDKVFINESQYFDDVPEMVWNFYVGKYYPAQKWLLHKKGTELNLNDILIYQKIIIALKETIRVMKEIDKIIIHLDI